MKQSQFFSLELAPNRTLSFSFFLRGGANMRKNVKIDEKSDDNRISRGIDCELTPGAQNPLKQEFFVNQPRALFHSASLRSRYASKYEQQPTRRGAADFLV